jgi:ribonuclease VapC
VIVDTSALVAILRREPEAYAFSRAIASAEAPRMTAANWLEAAMVSEGRGDAIADERLDDIIARLRVEIVPVTAELARRARAAWRVYGKGRHPAALNFGDSMSYALAKERDEPLLFKGDDFARTDVKQAL